MMAKKSVLGMMVLLMVAMVSVSQAAIAEWEFETGALTADSSGNGNVLTNLGVTSPLPADAPAGVGGNSAYFNGAASMQANVSLWNAKRIEISWYMKSGTTTQIVFEQSGNYYNSNAGFAVYIDAGSVWGMRSGATCTVDGGYSGDTIVMPADGEWHEYKFVLDNEKTGADHGMLYCDGVAGTDFTGGTFTVTPFINDTLYLGARESSSLFFSGNLDQLSIVPEPISILMMCLGGIAVLRRKS